MGKFEGRELPSPTSSSTPKTPPASSQLARALREVPYAGLRHVRCDFSDGLAVLYGRTPSHYLKQVAQEVVRKLDGVQLVENHIIVRPSDENWHVWN